MCFPLIPPFLLYAFHFVETYAENAFHFTDQPPPHHKHAHTHTYTHTHTHTHTHSHTHTHTHTHIHTHTHTHSPMWKSVLTGVGTRKLLCNVLKHFCKKA